MNKVKNKVFQLTQKQGSPFSNHKLNPKLQGKKANKILESIYINNRKLRMRDKIDLKRLWKKKGKHSIDR